MRGSDAGVSGLSSRTLAVGLDFSGFSLSGLLVPLVCSDGRKAYQYFPSGSNLSLVDLALDQDIG